MLWTLRKSDKDPRNAVLYGVAFSVRERQAVYVPLMQPDLDGVSPEEVRTRLEKILRISAVPRKSEWSVVTA